ncbi:MULTISPECIES: substrate-binding domain-containing protein [Lysinibacillus]|jgi:branched-chain amino acid transport system substrate-binding protein|uniref:substrate-binding domain-containing protein n=1 Tax=Lysinibacillus TaxID=400634 RepID=UPI00055F79FC|nr:MULTISPECIES: substrate-binding domain-containing protein [Lysinibacillus]MEE3806445.1 substrate-binding domain-containing protein [Lysinibacillus fusiformis]KUF36174.1 ABC transporter permease [Lysinibacillus sp. F5]WCH45758.1 substrate-binding domain-containing protein [Lysinibacillus sp. OF-1]SCY38983.1 amino acid/amide ABC transporter substrate-binding protein, HAAT family [Lysinibacillus sp. SG9]SDB18722.1 amino acid/amide ABC transporter substrate-binding protein, HAAT family [Lysinib
MKKRWYWFLLVMLAVVLVACSGEDTKDDATDADSSDGETKAVTAEGGTIKIGVLASLTGALESYGKQTQRGFDLGIEYATGGTMEVNGKKIEVVYEDTETKPEVAVQKATKLLEDDQVDFLVGSSSSGDTLAVLPLAEEYEKIMVVEPAVADSITGSEFNEYIFRTGRNSSQDAYAAAAAIAGKGVKIATFAPDYSFGWDGVNAFKTAAEKLGADIVLEEYADPAATDFTSNLQKVLDAKPDYLFVVWAGANSPWNQIADLKIQEKGIKISTGAPDIIALQFMNPLVGMEGFSVYYHTLPQNDVNKWLVEEHQKRFNEVPDLFTPGGMSAAIAIMEALKKSEGDADANKLIGIMEGMSFETPKGTMTFREEDHQALQSMYSIRLEQQDGVDYPVPVLIRELSPEETAPPVMN